MGKCTRFVSGHECEVRLLSPDFSLRYTHGMSPMPLRRFDSGLNQELSHLGDYP